MKHSKSSRGGRDARPVDAGPSQRQLRAGELVRHALATVLREEDIQDPAMVGVSVTVTEVRMSPDLRHATCFVEPLGGAHAPEVVAGLNRAAKFLRGRLGKNIELKFTPDLKFLHDESFDNAAYMNRLFNKPEVARDLEAPSPKLDDDQGDR
jgi:ribosome-binding factor A